MEDTDPLGKIMPLLRANVLAGALGTLGLAAIGYGLVFTSGPSSQSEIIIQEENEESTGSILVDISGAVEKPGVYELPSSARVSDAVEAAGGLREEADSVYIAKNVNLAQKMADGEKLYLPFISEAQDSQVMGDKSGKVSINSADSAALESLPGIGPVTAEKIIKNRPYSSINDILTKKSVGQAVFSEIKEMISL